ncbi:aminopeptidase [soil metagenome]
MAGLGLMGVVLLAGAAVCSTSGCSTLGYYAQSVRGHLAIVGSAKPVSTWLADDRVPTALKERLTLSQRIRDFAVSELKEPDNASYRRYADLHRPAAVWNVVAAPELSLTLQTWCFPVVGCVGYRGYFDKAEAEGFAAGLASDAEGAKALEVNVYPVPAYSTLGALPGDWLADPLLSTFINYPEGELARLIFHELAHQVAYAKNDTVFNESFAVTVERIGGARWLAERGGPKAREEYEHFEGRREDFRAITRRYRDALGALYTGPLTDEAKLAGKAELMAKLRADYATLKTERWGGFSGYDGWFARANNASFGVLAAYNQLVPEFERLFEREGRDFDRFYAEVKRLAKLPKAERRAALSTP